MLLPEKPIFIQFIPEDAVAAIIAPELVARIEVLLLGAGVHKHSVTLLAGARPYLSQVLIQSCLSCEDNTAAATFILWKVDYVSYSKFGKLYQLSRDVQHFISFSKQNKVKDTISSRKLNCHLPDT